MPWKPNYFTALVLDFLYKYREIKCHENQVILVHSALVLDLLYRYGREMSRKAGYFSSALVLDLLYRYGR